ncbi:MAG: hypothetical protein KAX77_04880 [Xanthomonadales bacterium]|nr:hypothetical protein [Xanthomonadales bacterium]
MLVLGGLLAFLGYGCLRHAAGKPKGVAIGYASIGAIWVGTGLFVAALLPILHGAMGVAALATAVGIVAILKQT